MSRLQLCVELRARGLTARDTTGVVIVEGAPVSRGREAIVMNAGYYRFFAGWRSDPFFFDTLGAQNDLKFTGQDYFAERNICSIVLEVPIERRAFGRRVR